MPEEARWGGTGRVNAMVAMVMWRDGSQEKSKSMGEPV